MSASKPVAQQLLNKKPANEYFESLLEDLGLSRSTLEQQPIEELQESLVRVDDALRSAEFFGVVRLKITASAGAIIASNQSEAHFEVGIAPLLLERKKLITDRLRQLRGGIKINSLRDLIETISDEELRKQLRTELEATHQSKAELEQEVEEGSAFVAMAMDPDNPQLVDVLDAIKEGANKSGITAERVDETQTNEPITDHLLRLIDKAEFVVVDLTSSRPNVYYEAGYAQGIGKTPVYVAREGTDVQFDLAGYPIVFYPNMRGLKEELANRLNRIRSGRKLA
jgi:hypothetical protein